MRRASIATALAASVLVTHSAVGAVNSWTALGPEGGKVTRILFNPSNPSTVYAIAASGFYLSTDGGATWRLTAAADLNGFSDVAFDPSNPSRVIVVGANPQPMLVSSNAGQTFSAVTSYPSGETYHLQWSSDGTTVYATANRAFLRSTDHGQSWQERTDIVANEPYGPVQQLLVDPNDANVLYAAIADSPTTIGLYRSRDGAGSWQLLGSPTVPTLGLAIAPDSSNLWAARSDGLWVSTDAGQTWSVTQFPGGAFAITVDPSNPTTVYAADQTGELYRSPDRGGTWTDISTNIGAGLLYSIAVRPGQSAQILVAGLGGVAATSTAGANWNMSQSGLIATRVVSLGADPIADRVYVGVDAAGLFYSAGGAAQLTATNNLQLQYLNSPYRYWSIETALVQAGGRLFVSLGNRVARSSDGGNTWVQLPLRQYTGSSAAGSLASSPLALSTILASSNLRGLYRSLDSGDTWAPVTAGLPTGPQVSFITGAASDPNVFYALAADAAANSGLYRSNDAGATWSIVSGLPTPGLWGLAIDPTDPLTLYDSTLAGIYRTNDGGIRWSALPWLSDAHDIPLSFMIDPAHPRIIYAASNTAIARSIDSGATWQQVPNPPHLMTWAGSIQIDPLRPHRLFAGSLYNGTYEISIEPDLALQMKDPGTNIGLQTPTVYHYTVTNNGPYDATGEVLTLQLPASASGTTATPSAGKCSLSGSTVACALGDILNGANATVDLTTTPTTVGAFNVTASVAGDQPDSAGANNSVTSMATIAESTSGSVTVNSPKSGGGGALDSLSDVAIGLSLWAALRRRRQPQHGNP